MKKFKVKERPAELEVKENGIYKLIPKIIYGTDKIGNSYIYFKMKDIGTGLFLDRFYILLYQKNNPESIERVKRIIELIEKKFSVTDTVSAKTYDRKTFFIKGKNFNTYNRIRNFYSNLIKTLLCELGNKNIDPKCFESEDDYLFKNGILNYRHK